MSALEIIDNVHVKASHVLIHCSDGWDRTAQLTRPRNLPIAGGSGAESLDPGRLLGDCTSGLFDCDAAFDLRR